METVAIVATINISQTMEIRVTPVHVWIVSPPVAMVPPSPVLQRGQYEHKRLQSLQRRYDHDGNHNTACKSCTDTCPNGQTLTGSCEGTSNKYCESCPSGKWDHDGNPNTACIPHSVTTCGRGKRYDTDSALSDGDCIPSAMALTGPNRAIPIKAVPPIQ